MIELSRIRSDGGTQSRATINEETVSEYAEAMADPKTVFPPVIVYYDGKDYWLADGFHRVAAWARIGREEVPADVRQGDRRAAVLQSCAANAAHGLRRTNADKRRAVMTLLEDDEWSKWSSREIARRCGVSDMFVGKIKGELSANGLQIGETRTVERGGTVYQQSTANIGAKPVHEPSETPGADKAGISVADAADGPAPEPEEQAVGGNDYHPAEAVASRSKPHQEETSKETKDVSEQQSSGPIADQETDEAHDPVHAEKLDVAPEDNPKLRAEYRRLSGEAREDEWVNLRLSDAEQKKRIASQRSEIAGLKQKVRELSNSDDPARKLAAKHKQLLAANFKRDEAMTTAKRFEYRMKQAEKERDEMRRQFEAQEISL